MNKKQKKMLTRIVITAVMLFALHFIPLTGIPQLACYLVAYGVIGYDILNKAAKGILNGQVFDENFLMAVATVGAFALAIYEGSGDYNEAIAVMLFYQIGELFQSYAVGKSRRNISALMDIRPDYANVERDGRIEKVDPDEVGIGSIIVVQPGEKVPLDGVIVEGNSSLNTSALTGESLPRDAKEGDEIISIVYQNIVFALIIKFACLALGAIGIANMWPAFLSVFIIWHKLNCCRFCDSQISHRSFLPSLLSCGRCIH